MDILEQLNKVNDVPILSVKDPAFVTYGRVLTGYDFSDLISYMEEHTTIPEEGNVYVASVETMECMPQAVILRDTLYGGMPVQIGYCNGKNSTYNGFEYHKGSEINIAITDFMLVLGHSYDICDNTYDVASAQVFFVPKGTAIEMYQTTLHLSPLRVWESGFKGIVVLPAGTNTPLSAEEKARRDMTDKEQRLLLQRNKWVIAHPDREPLIKQGAYPGVQGENKCLKYCSML
jgi:hypothetical protein